MWVYFKSSISDEGLRSLLSSFLLGYHTIAKIFCSLKSQFLFYSREIMFSVISNKASIRRQEMRRTANVFIRFPSIGLWLYHFTCHNLSRRAGKYKECFTTARQGFDFCPRWWEVPSWYCFFKAAKSSSWICWGQLDNHISSGGGNAGLVFQMIFSFFDIFAYSFFSENIGELKFPVTRCLDKAAATYVGTTIGSKAAQ